MLRKIGRLVISHRLAWGAVILCLAAMGAALYVKRSTWLPYYEADFAVWPPVLVISSDDWGDVLSSRESPADLDDLAAVLRRFRDRYGNHPVVTAYVNPAKPDFARIAESGFKEYSWRFRYDDEPEMVEKWKSLSAEGLVEMQFHGREHVNVALWLAALRDDVPGFREQFRLGRIPYVHDAVYQSRLALDKRFGFLFRSYIDATMDPPRSLPLGVQAEMVRSGVELMREHFGAAPSVAVPPGHVWDVNTLEAYRAAGIAFFEVPEMPVTAVGRYLERIANAGIVRWQSRPHGVGALIRNCIFEPGWQEANRLQAAIAARGAAAKARELMSLGIPVVVGTHAVHYTGDVRKRDANLAGLATLIDEVQRAYPDVAFLSASQLAAYMYDVKAQPARPIPFRKVALTQFGRIEKAMRGMLLHERFQAGVFVLGAALAWALLASLLRLGSRRPRRR